MSLMDDYQKFRSQLVNAVNATLQNDMIDPIVIAMIDSAERRVYDVYTPIPDGYERRETDDGLKDPMNYKFYSGDMEVGVENVLRCLSAEHSYQQGDDSLHDEGIAVCRKHQLSVNIVAL